MKNNFTKTTLRFLTFIVLVLVTTDVKAIPVDFYWVDNSVENRTDVGIFIREFEVTGHISQANFELFADSRYLLRINGVAVGSGPSRFFPERKYYDTYDITPYLKTGKNIIAVKVLSHGMNTFQTPKSGAKIWANGIIKAGNGNSVSLAMGNNWLCRRYLAHSRQTHKINFALGPIELHEYGNDSFAWFRKDMAINWATPVLLKSGTDNNKFLPREIPFLRQREISPLRVFAVRSFKDEYDFYSVHLLEDDRTIAETAVKYPASVYTYIDSPKEQAVDVLLWWGEYFLNGEKVAISQHPPKQNHAQQYTLNLKKGRNLFFAKSELRWAYLDFYLAIPKAADLNIGLNAGEGSFGVKIYGADASEERDAVPVNQEPAGFTVRKNEKGKLNPVWNIAWQPLQAPMNQLTGTFPLTVSANTGISIDFGQKRLGRVVVTYEAPRGVSFDLAFTEDTDDGLPFTLKRHMMFIGAGFVSGGGEETFESFHPYGLRYVQLNVRGDDDQKVVIKSVELIDETYPYDFTGEFECSDQALNEIWKLGPNSLTACSEDAYLDTPFRERGTYAGDALPSYAINLALQNDSRILKNTLNYLRGSFAHWFKENTPPRADGIYGNPDDFPLLFVQSLNWYYEQTGDRAFMSECYPEIQYLLDNWLLQKKADGVFGTPNRAFIEWVEMDKFGGEHTVLNAYLAEAFRIFGSWSEDLGNQPNAEKYAREHEALKSAITKIFWNEKLGAFHDGTKADKALGTAHPLASAVCLHYNIATEEQIQSSLSFISKELKDIGNQSRKRKATPYGSFYILHALYKYDRAEVAERFVKQYWSPMIINGADTAWENFDNTGIGTLSHVWSAHPTYFLSSQVLGVNILDNQSDRDVLVLSPLSDQLTWAKGKVPHPKAGLVEVSWEKVGEKLFVNYSTENPVEVSIEPRGKLSKLVLIVNSPDTKK